ncbi:peroxiredoxin [Lutibacter sp.]|uniref:peroxiredoxin n=1 Tax=Lutibacter sp. TaxID=1925666 RepID=UPI0025C1AA6E|nr:peroxiredoxin [Lutibacter sp.]MCF6181524.1 peroxiredoxin [Lutibacter sp.]
MKKMKILIIVTIVLGVLILKKEDKNMKKIEVGDAIPTINLKDENGVEVNINAIKKPLIIYFYPKDETPGCIKEACKFRDEFQRFTDLGVQVFGISGDSSASHKKFKEKYHLPFTLLADTNNEIRKKFGVPKSLLFLPGRVTYVVNKNGIVTYMFNSQFGAEKHIEKTLEFLNKNKADIN